MSEAGNFDDPMHEDIILPFLYESQASTGVKWLRPNEFIRIAYIDRELKSKFPHKDIIEIRNKAKEIYLKNKAEVSNSNNDKDDNNLSKKFKRYSTTVIYHQTDSNSELSANDNLQQLLNKEIFKYYEKDINFRIVTSETIFESEEEEKNKKKEEFELELKSRAEAKNSTVNQALKKQTVAKQVIVYEPSKIINYFPNDISTQADSPKYTKWISSILQSIKDLDIVDINDVRYLIKL